MTPVSRIKFYSKVPRIREAWTRVVTNPYERCEFTTGLGPCGLYVSKLLCEVSADFLTITQEAGPTETHVTEVKKFIYLTSELTGRVEVTTV